MSQRVATAYQPLVAVYDAAESPGPYPDVVEAFRPRRYDEEPEPVDEVAKELARYAVVLVSPDHTKALGFDRDEVGLKLYLDGYYEDDPATLHAAATTIAEECGVPVTLVEHRADLTYWTARHTPAPIDGASGLACSPRG